MIFGPPGVAAAASGFDVTVVKDGDEVEAGSFTLRFFGEKHAVIHSSIPVVDNVGVLVNGQLYYAGDSFTIPDGVEVDTVAVPAGAPWMKIGEAMDYVLALKPRRAFPTHEMVLSVAGKGLSNQRLQGSDRGQRRGVFPAGAESVAGPVAVALHAIEGGLQHAAKNRPDLRRVDRSPSVVCNTRCGEGGDLWVCRKPTSRSMTRWWRG